MRENLMSGIEEGRLDKSVDEACLLLYFNHPFLMTRRTKLPALAGKCQKILVITFFKLWG